MRGCPSRFTYHASRIRKINDQHNHRHIRRRCYRGRCSRRGLLILNQGKGALLASLSSAQVFVLVYLASTLTACVVTLWSVRQELGGRVALAMVGRQAGTAVVTTLLLVFLVSLG